MRIKRKFYLKFLAVSVLICLMCMTGAWMVRSNLGKIKIKDISILDGNGHKIAATMFIPSTATKETPAPAVVALHGSFNARESESYLCYELARRGYVGVTLDCDGHGDSDNYKENPMDAFFLVTAEPDANFESIDTAPTSGMAPLIEYLYDLSFVDGNQIGITGHSLGGKTTDAVYAYYKIQEINGGINKIKSVYLVDNQQLSINKQWMSHLQYHPSYAKNDAEIIELPYDVDFGVSLCKADENNGTTEAGGPWNFSKSNNARTFINELDEYDLKEGEAVKVGTYYRGHVDGSEKEYLRILNQPTEIHMLGPYGIGSNSGAIDFFQMSLSAPNEIDANNLIYPLEMFFNALGAVSFFLVIYAFCRWLLTWNYFSLLCAQSESEIYRPAPPKKLIDKAYYWGFMIIGSIIPVMWMIPLAMWVGGHKGETFAARSLFGTILWPQGNQLEQGLWVATAGIWTVALFTARYWLSIRKIGNVKPSDWNLKISIKECGRTILLAFLSVGMGYFMAFVASYFFGSYFGLLNWVIRWPNSRMILIALRYVPIFFMFYLTNAFTQNIGRMISGRKEWKNVALMCAINGLGLLLLWIYQYSMFSVLGKVPLNSARVMQTWSFFIVQSVCTIFARKLYLQTGKLYLGALINALVFTMISVGHTMTLNVSNWWF